MADENDYRYESEGGEMNEENSSALVRSSKVTSYPAFSAVHVGDASFAARKPPLRRWQRLRDGVARLDSVRARRVAAMKECVSHHQRINKDNEAGAPSAKQLDKIIKLHELYMKLRDISRTEIALIEHLRISACALDIEMRDFDHTYGGTSKPLQFVKITKLLQSHRRHAHRTLDEEGWQQHRHRRRVTAKDLFSRPFRIRDPVAVRYDSNGEVNWIWGHVIAVHNAHCIVEDADTERINPCLPIKVPHGEIVRLPSSGDVLDIHKGDTVFARYPETTAFYKAAVVQDRGREYILEFAEDSVGPVPVKRDGVTFFIPNIVERPEYNT